MEKQKEKVTKNVFGLHRHSLQYTQLQLVCAPLMCCLMLYALAMLHTGSQRRLPEPSTQQLRSRAGKWTQRLWPGQGLGGAVFNASQFDAAGELLRAHQQWQSARLHHQTLSQAPAIQGTQPMPPQAVLYKQMQAGWGNRLPGLATGLLIAALTGRVFLVAPDNNITSYLDFHWDVEYFIYAHMYVNASTCIVDVNRLTQPDLNFCGGSSGATVMEYSSLDYDIPLLEVNPVLQTTMQHLFPHGNIFHVISTQLFSFSLMVQRAAAQYARLSDECIVGVHIRTGKQPLGTPGVPVQNLTVQFAGIVRSMAGNLPGSVFVAADTDLFGGMLDMLPGRVVWWSNETHTSLHQKNTAGNPGSDLSAFVDLFLLSKCQQLVLTAGSSFGLVAAGYSNTIPVHAVAGPHETPFFNPYFWKGLSSEPHFFKAGRGEQKMLSETNLKLMLANHNHALQLQQLHW